MIMCTTTAKSFQMKPAFIRGFLEIEALDVTAMIPLQFLTCFPFD
jgi:hypothetical protein